MNGAPETGPGYSAVPEEFPIGPRPYAVTRGRTRSSFHLGVEVLVTALAPPQGGGAGYPPQTAASFSPEHRTIHRLCHSPLSVAELAALSHVPLGVARILIADLAEAGLVHVQAGQSTPGGQPDMRLLERVLGGLRSL
ncbi:DUF742 domain-containing protein [Streptomyces sp. NPDC059104]|uniref:DUF742 domain-containing protein n=1 Tax=Streptomyces sp. NPDC059104 TaxID=3346729 RepID=UPI0036B9DE04